MKVNSILKQKKRNAGLTGFKRYGARYCERKYIHGEPKAILAYPTLRQIESKNTIGVPFAATLNGLDAIVIYRQVWGRMSIWPEIGLWEYGIYFGISFGWVKKRTHEKGIGNIQNRMAKWKFWIIQPMRSWKSQAVFLNCWLISFGKWNEKAPHESRLA